MKPVPGRAGYYIVLVNHQEVARFASEREAIEDAQSRVKPGLDVRYYHDYEVVVQQGAAPLSVPLGGQTVRAIAED